MLELKKHKYFENLDWKEVSSVDYRGADKLVKELIEQEGIQNPGSGTSPQMVIPAAIQSRRTTFMDAHLGANNPIMDDLIQNAEKVLSGYLWKKQGNFLGRD